MPDHQSHYKRLSSLLSLLINPETPEPPVSPKIKQYYFTLILLIFSLLFDFKEMATFCLWLFGRATPVALINERPFATPLQACLSPLLEQNLNMLCTNLQQVMASFRLLPTPALNLATMVADLMAGLPQNLKV